MKNVLSESSSVLQCLEKLCTLPEKDTLTLFILNNNHEVLGTVTDGDLRRYLVSGGQLNDNVTAAMKRNFSYVLSENELFEKNHIFRKKSIRLIPLVDNNHKLIKIFDLQYTKSYLPIDAVIMAGGRGERLSPLTDTTPKPLLPLGDKVIMEYNVDNIASMGIYNVTVCVRYLGEQIMEYFGDGSSRGINMRYVTEDKPLGTLGALTHIDHLEHDVVLVMNSDLFTDINLEEFYRHFIESGADMSVAATPYNISVPYAVMKTEKDYVISFEEKPTYTYYSNAGMYLIKRSLLNSLPKDVRFDATDLMAKLISSKGKLTYFPIIGYWLDIGTPEEYRKAREIIQFIKV